MTEMDEIVARAEAAIGRATSLRGSEVAAFTAELASLPEGEPERSRLAVSLVMALNDLTRPVSLDVLPHLDGLLRLVDHVPASLAIWPQVRAFTRAQVLMHSAGAGERIDHAAADRELAEAEEVLRGSRAAKNFVALAREMVAATADDTSNMPVGLRRVVDMLIARLDELPDHPLGGQIKSCGEMLKKMADATRKHDPMAVRQLLQDLQDQSAALPLDMGLTPIFDKSREDIEVLLDLTDPTTSAHGRAAAEQKVKERTTSGSPSERAMMLVLAAAGCFGENVTDVARVEEGIAQCREAAELTRRGEEVHAFALGGAAMGMYRRSELTGSVRGLDEAEEVCARLLELLDERDPQWTTTNELLAAIRQRLGDLDTASTFDSSAQRTHVWRALLEPDPAEAGRSVKNAAETAIGIAHRCVVSNRVTDALRALDTGRGLLLFAETELRRIPARLTAMGHRDLAERWEREGRDSVPLRREVLAAVRSHPESVGSLLDPPSHAEIRTALTATGADALVYLVPGDNAMPGLAVIAPKDGPAAFMMLHNLQVGRGSDAERYLVALADRSREVEPPPGAGFSEMVGVLCDWAWNSAIGPLLETYFARALPGGEPRIVLVPMGDLARIPWQAARRADGVHAVQLAAFSQAVSARLFCENARKSRIRPTSTALVVGDPDTKSPAIPLKAARVEAYAVRNAFYRGGRYVGRRPNNSNSPSGRGTLTEVREWLADAAPQAGTTLHLACHGRFAGGESSGRAELLLAPDDADGPGPGELNAAEIMRVLAAVPERRIGLVVIAACNTGRSIHGYDEAYSLGTAFLAAGARTVLSTQWAIPDEETSALMFVFHHHLREEGLPPWDALRRAQLWMLDPDREPPASMPADLASMVANHHDVVAWAGFVHGGH